MNTKAIYAAGGGIAAVAVAIFLIMSTGIFNNNNSSGQGFNQGALMNMSLQTKLPIELQRFKLFLMHIIQTWEL
jgi:hypothetical protein